MTDTIDDKKPWFLAGNYAPVRDEVTDTNLRVTGSITAVVVGPVRSQTVSNPKSGTAATGSSETEWFTVCASKGGRATWYRKSIRANTQTREGSRRDGPRLHSRSDRQRRQHSCPRSRRPNLGLGGGATLPWELSSELETIRL